MSDWGQGSKNNDIGWGQGANNEIGWGAIHALSYSGDTDIVGGTPIDERFIITVKTDNAGTSASNQFTIPTNTSGITQAFNYDIETSDGQTITGLTGNHTITFPSAGTYDIYISGSFPYIFFNNGGDKLKLLDIKNFGIYALGATSQYRSFWGCSNMVITATDSGNFGSVTSFLEAFYGCTSLTSFPFIDFSSASVINNLFTFCSSLTTLPPNLFDNTVAKNLTNSFLSTNLTTQSIDNILVSLDTAGQSNGTFTQSGGQAPSATGEAAIDSLVGKGWTITVTGGYQPTQLLLDEYPNAAAAYSLRELSTSFVGQPVVRVRRSLDNAEQDFTATEITDGTLVNFNQFWYESPTIPFTTFTSTNYNSLTATKDTSGASDAYLGIQTGVQGDIVQVTLDVGSITGTWQIVLINENLNNQGSNFATLTSGSNTINLTANQNGFGYLSITSSTSASSISVTNITVNRNIGNDCFITTLYDQSGNGNNATQATATSQPIIINNAVFITDTSNNISLDFYNKNLITPSIDISNVRSTFLVLQRNGNGTGYENIMLQNGGNYHQIYNNPINYFNGAVKNTNLTLNSSLSLLDIIQGSSLGSSFLNGISGNTWDGISGSTNAAITISNFKPPNFSSNSMNGLISEMIIYPSDQSANRTGIETNINNEYAIY